MIKNIILNIKLFLKILKIGKKYFRFPNKLLFYITSQNSFQKLFSKIVIKQTFNFYELDSNLGVL